MNVRRVGRLGMLAVGLGVGAALALCPGMAFADSSSDWLASIDGLLAGAALPASSSGLNLAVSYDGYSLLQEGTANAHTAAGEYGLAIAEGSGAYANAGGGNEGAFAGAGGLAGLSRDGNNDTAIDIGNNSGLDDGSDALGGSNNFASESGTMSG